MAMEILPMSTLNSTVVSDLCDPLCIKLVAIGYRFAPVYELTAQSVGPHRTEKTKSSLKKIIAFAAEGSNNSDTDKIMARMDAMTMKMDAQYKDFQSRSKQSNLDDDDIPMSHEEEAKFMQTFRHTRFYNDYRDRDSNRDNWHSSGRNNYNRDNYQSHSDDKPDL
ncbi:hypothetical protein Tco_0411647 [Tanacetum coccineum]